MLKVFFSGLICLLFVIVLLPSTSFAYYYKAEGMGEFEDYRFFIGTSMPETEDMERREAPEFGQPVKITITAGLKTAEDESRSAKYEKIFETSPKPDVNDSNKYTLVLTSKDQNTRQDKENPIRITATTSSDEQIEFFWYARSSESTDFSPGRINITLYHGDASKINKNNARMFGPLPIFVDQPGGGAVQIAAITEDLSQNLICPGIPIRFNLIQSSLQQNYVFFWENQGRELTSQAGTGTPITTIELKAELRNLPSIDPGTYNLCMRPGGGGFFFSYTCYKHKIPFIIPDDTKMCKPDSKKVSCSLLAGTVDNKAGSSKYTLTAILSGFKAGQYRLDILDTKSGQNVESKSGIEIDSTGNANVSFRDTVLKTFPVGKYSIYVYPQDSSVRVCENEDTGNVKSEPGGGTIPTIPLSKCDTNPTIDGRPNPKYCGTAFGTSCNPGDPSGKVVSNGKGVLTAIGCVPTQPEKFIEGVMKYVLGMSGGIALLLMAFGSFQMVTSSGNPDSIKKGQEQFTNAVIGLLFIIFSTLLMQILGVDILGLPGFTK